MPNNDPADKPSDRMTNSDAPRSTSPAYYDGQRVRSPWNSRRDSARKDQVELWPPKPHVPVPIEHI
jgi:hypothetical protein